ncbi:hypothetical protein TNCV_648581 [Trichonephila clavipes]|uniref:Uncharacterized protein n=1 Tax=Trichonephila clavipes TaxID=2585209 RepID=A0A8X6SNH9_TRICX|nr:hypothetical protein TNCV_648581 [Trichonephila clavipes]
MFDGLVAFAMDRWRHDCGARRVRIISRPGSPMSEGRFDLSTFRSERTNEASTLTITPKRSSSRDVGTSSYRYHTATDLMCIVSLQDSNLLHIGREFVIMCPRLPGPLRVLREIKKIFLNRLIQTQENYVLSTEKVQL